MKKQKLYSIKFERKTYKLSAKQIDKLLDVYFEHSKEMLEGDQDYKELAREQKIIDSTMKRVYSGKKLTRLQISMIKEVLDNMLPAIIEQIIPEFERE